MPRYAIYFTPAPAADLWQFGCAVLGYDSWQRRDVAYPECATADHGTFATWSATPQRYGFHATLKAPFHLIENADEAHVVAAVRELARGLTPFGLGRLQVSAIGRFIALVPVASPPALADLAFACVESCEHLRAPLTEADRERRQKSGLTGQQAHYLEQYGYPYVKDAFRFHMTLTGPLEGTERDRAQSVLRDLYGIIDRPVALDAVTLARQDDGERFVLLERCPLG